MGVCWALKLLMGSMMDLLMEKLRVLEIRKDSEMGLQMVEKMDMHLDPQTWMETNKNCLLKRHLISMGIGIS